MLIGYARVSAQDQNLERKRPVFAVCTACRSVVMMWGWWMLS